MRATKATKTLLLAVLLCLMLLCLGCSPRDFLTRRLAADLISTSDTFKAPQLFWLRTGIVSNQYSSPAAGSGHDCSGYFECVTRQWPDRDPSRAARTAEHCRNQQGG